MSNQNNETKNQSLREIVDKIKKDQNKVTLIYAFNGTGKTRLSTEFKNSYKKNLEEGEETKDKFIYYNAFTEDLFFWDNDLDNDHQHILKIKPNDFTSWIFKEQGLDQKVSKHFQKYINNKLTPNFNENFNEITFSLNTGDDNKIDNLKISKGEESNFIWSVFYSLFKEIIENLNQNSSDRSIHDFDDLEYIFIDDPVSSLDENHLIQQAIDISDMIKSSNTDELKFIITTHSPLFYNVLYNELNSKKYYILSFNKDGTYNLESKKGDSNTAFSYHLHIKKLMHQAINEKQVSRYHFTLLRNLYEKTASFLGYTKWSDLLPDDKNAYIRRMNLYSHSTLSGEEVAELPAEEKKTLEYLLDSLENYGFNKEDKSKE